MLSDLKLTATAKPHNTMLLKVTDCFISRTAPPHASDHIRAKVLTSLKPVKVKGNVLLHMMCSHYPNIPILNVNGKEYEVELIHNEPDTIIFLQKRRSKGGVVSERAVLISCEPAPIVI